MTHWRVIVGDVSKVANELEPESFEACLCDPPYGFAFMGKQWDKGVPSADVWRVIGQALRPGAHLMAFGGPRTQHRLGCAIEDGGFEIRDVLAWLFGSGFPKNHNIDKAIDRAAGAEREIVGVRKMTGTARKSTTHGGHGAGATSASDPRDFVDTVIEVTAPATPDAQRFDGYGTALKPAYEPVILARKPPGDSVARCCVEHGTGALNIDGARIETAAPIETTRTLSFGDSGEAYGDGVYTRWRNDQGRWPANVVLDEEAGRLLDAQSGELTTNAGQYRSQATPGMYGAARRIEDRTSLGDAGGESRFFYCAKASRAEREAGLGHRRPRIVSDGRAVTNDTAYQRERRNVHPTVKPIDLARWLSTLLLPPTLDRPRRILVPFSGSGSEMIGCLLAGWDEVVGIELSEEYASIAQARLKHWQRYRRADSEAADKEALGQGSLFG